VQTSRTYCAANIDDLSAVVGHVKKRYTGSQLFAVGVSLGGYVLVFVSS
jgi:predicted alpha/beta-fold hydrolase